MQPVGRRPNAHAEAYYAPATGGEGNVLPKFLRKPVRQVSRLLNGGFQVSGRGLAIFGVCFALVTASAGLVANGQAGKIMAHVSPAIGLKHISYEITGSVETSQMDVIAAVAPIAEGSLLTMDAEAARKALAELPWVADATVTKRFPDKLAISLTERTAYALWQNRDGLYLVDREGQVLGEFDGRNAALPLMVGEGAAEEAAGVLALVSRYPTIAGQVVAYQRIGSRRWDLRLANGIQVMLPEHGSEGQLQRLVQLDRDKDIFNRAIDKIDMRIAGRTVFGLSPEASEEITSIREEQQKLIERSKREREI